MASQEFQQRARLLNPTLSIGKNGITEGCIRQLNQDLEHHSIVKVRFLKGFLQQRDRHDAATELAIRTKARLLSIVGNTCVLHRIQKDAARSKDSTAARKDA